MAQLHRDLQLMEGSDSSEYGDEDAAHEEQLQEADLNQAIEEE